MIVLFCHQFSFAQTEINLDGRDSYIEKAMTQFDRGNWDEGKKTVDLGLKRYPFDSDLKMLSGKYHHHKGQNEKARYDLVKALQINPDNVDAKQILVNVELETERYSSAICYVNELLEVNPYWRGLWRKKIELYKLQGNFVEANRLQERISQIYPDDKKLKEDYIYAMELDAAAKRKEGDIDGAIEISKKLLKENPEKVENYILMANDYLKAGDLNTALSYLDRGLNSFPENSELINKKAGVLAQQKKYDELLPFLQKKGYAQQYSYYLMEAARYSKNQQTHILYGKIFEENPGNEEAFDNIYNYTVAVQQYDEALRLIKVQRRVNGDSKELYLKELAVYEMMGNDSKSIALTKRLFERYPNDYDVQNAYVKVIFEEAKYKMSEKRYAEAIDDWYKVIQYGDEDYVYVARNSIFNAHVELGEYLDALNVLNELIANDKDNKDFYLKRADLYYRQKNFNMALSAYENILDQTEGNQRNRFLSGYGNLSTLIIKDLVEVFRYDQALQYAERWLEQDPKNELALRYAINLSYQTNSLEKAYLYAESGNRAHPNSTFFIVKMAEITAENPENYEEVYNLLLEKVSADPYNQDLINAYAQITEDYSHQLIRGERSPDAIENLDNALRYAPNNNTLKYTKGIAYEKIKNYDSAYYYQSFYVPSPQEEKQFNHYLYYLYYKSLDNEIGLHHLRSRPGDIDVINPISAISYSHIDNNNTYSGRINYAGRPPGKGYQIQAAWMREWNYKTTTLIDAAWANQFFPTISINASIFRDITKLKEVNLELGIGYRILDTVSSNANLGNRNMFNFVVGATKVIDDFRINARLNNFILDGRYLYNLTVNGRYTLWSPKHYVTAMAGVGSSPDVELLDYQVYDGFSALNTMVGAGFTYMFAKNVSFGVLGTWYNYRNNDGIYRNHHNIFLNLNVAF
ncbi:hypothetical protein DIT68_09175 [Brumimicrobium oceani]|uniref:YaiO beta-barrel domain-containing protein n=2 Tax=Brumimicrobium oceani TaxID=2100725 RepID=A0A2U2XC90_9FLAO|nr:hypothetical protein DIT68_09175 [Brumimicrobium oceani]